MIVILGHATYIDGKIYESPVNTVVEIMIKKKKDFIHVRHSMDGMIASTIIFYERGKVAKEKKLPVISKIAPLRYISEVFCTVFFFLFYKQKLNGIGVDPLNALSVIILKKLGKFKRAIFYTADYSPARFENKMLDKFYHSADRFSSLKADQVWNVSLRICDIRKKMGVPDEKNIFVPNVPSVKLVDSYKIPANKHSLITLGIIGEQLDFIGMFKAIKKLKKDYPDIVFKIIGNGPKEDQYKKYVKDNDLSQNVIFFGYLNHDRALEEISNSGVGLALYNGKMNFNYYGDSMKCREYFCFGLPVLTTDTHSTVLDIKENKAGVVCNMSPLDYEDAIVEIFNNYREFSKNSFSLAKQYDGIHGKYLSCLEENT